MPSVHAEFKRSNFQQQSSLFSSNRFIEHDVSTRKLGPSSGIRPSFLNRSIYTFLLLLPYAAKSLAVLSVKTYLRSTYGNNTAKLSAAYGKSNKKV